MVAKWVSTDKPYNQAWRVHNLVLEMREPVKCWRNAKKIWLNSVNFLCYLSVIYTHRNLRCKKAASERIPMSLQSVSDWGERARPTPLHLQG